MSREIARKIADAVLYEGYMLYPYRRSALKNRQRWSFGILYPPGYPEVRQGTERCAMHTECLLETEAPPMLQIQLRFLHLINLRRTPVAGDDGSSLPSQSMDDMAMETWDESVERVVEFDLAPDRRRQELPFGFPASLEAGTPHSREAGDCITSRTQHALSGRLTVFAKRIRQRMLKLSIDVVNTTVLTPQSADRDSALLCSLLSAHLILTARNSSFVSLLDPPKAFRTAAKACTNIGNFPVLVGNPGERDMLLCSPIVLYDYPAIAPESARDFYDATEMDEMLTLRVLTLTDDEKNQAKNGDSRVRDLLEQTEERARERLMRTHGVIRSLRPVSAKGDE